MKIMIVCSYAFYNQIPEVKNKLEEMNIEVKVPNGYDDENFITLYPDDEGFADWIGSLRKMSEESISKVDAILVLNYTKNDTPNYIGGSTFLEMNDAYRMNKKIYIMNDIPDGILTDEIIGFKPIVLNGDLSKIV